MRQSLSALRAAAAHPRLRMRASPVAVSVGSRAFFASAGASQRSRDSCSGAVLGVAALVAAAVGAGFGFAEAEERMFTMEEIQHSSKAGARLYVTHGDDVFDITDFVSIHPGGSKILLAAGSSVEPFWQLYNVHKNEEVYKMLQEMRVGRLKPGERAKAPATEISNAFAHEPTRHPALQPASERPFNAEPPAELLADSFHTPNDLFFVRNHMGVPAVDVNKYELAVGGPGIRKPLTLKLDDLKKYPKYTIDATLQCAGNRRSEMMNIKSVKGLRWGRAAISNASWSGARLVDVLKDAGLDLAELERAGIQHIQFEGLDRDESNFYGASVPIEMALNPLNDVILAYEMNGVDLPIDHGYPVRAIVPGTAGARNVKWLCKIELSTEESRSHWQRNDYKGFNASIDWDSVNFENAEAVQELPITSAICTPSLNDVVEADEDGIITVKGYAWSGGGRGVIRVDVSLDGGETWQEAVLQKPNQPRNRTWAWTPWQIELKVDGLDKATNNTREIQLVCKAVDSSYNVQPERFESIWNLRGILSNAWHRVPIVVKKT